jgi:hypothetical protein
MDRRTFIDFIARGLLAAPFVGAGAQQPRIPTIGVLSLDSPHNSTCLNGIRLGPRRVPQSLLLRADEVIR